MVETIEAAKKRSNDGVNGKKVEMYSMVSKDVDKISLHGFSKFLMSNWLASTQELVLELFESLVQVQQKLSSFFCVFVVLLFISNIIIIIKNNMNNI